MGCFCSRYESLPEKDEFVSIEGYVGDRNCLRQKHGRGQYYFTNGDMYDGLWRCDCKHGYGVYTYANGERLQGFFEQDIYIGTNIPESNSQEQAPKRTDSAERLAPPPSKLAQHEATLAKKAELKARRAEEHKDREKQRRQKREEIRKKWLGE